MYTLLKVEANLIKLKALISDDNDEDENFIIFSKSTNLIVHLTVQRSDAKF